MNIWKSRYVKILLTVLTALALTWLSSLTGHGDGTQGGAIAGLWRVEYAGDLVFESFDQWHKDGQEFEVANIFGISCQGTWEQMEEGTCGFSIPDGTTMPTDS
jgi:hypothetical protein